MESDKIEVLSTVTEEINEIVERTYTPEEMIDMVRPQLQGVNYSAIGFKNGIFKIYIKALAEYEWMPFRLFALDKEYIVDVVEELFLTILADNVHKEAFYKRKNDYLQSKGQEKQEFILKQKTPKKKGGLKIPEQVNLNLSGLSFK